MVADFARRPPPALSALLCCVSSVAPHSLSLDHHRALTQHSISFPPPFKPKPRFDPELTHHRPARQPLSRHSTHIAVVAAAFARYSISPYHDFQPLQALGTSACCGKRGLHSDSRRRFRATLATTNRSFEPHFAGSPPSAASPNLTEAIQSPIALPITDFSLASLARPARGRSSRKLLHSHPSARPPPQSRPCPSTPRHHRVPRNCLPVPWSLSKA